jgi:hypothetical protein
MQTNTILESDLFNPTRPYRSNIITFLLLFLFFFWWSVPQCIIEGPGSEANVTCPSRRDHTEYHNFKSEIRAHDMLVLRMI